MTCARLTLSRDVDVTHRILCSHSATIPSAIAQESSNLPLVTTMMFVQRSALLCLALVPFVGSFAPPQARLSSRNSLTRPTARQVFNNRQASKEMETHGHSLGENSPLLPFFHKDKLGMTPQGTEQRKAVPDYVEQGTSVDSESFDPQVLLIGAVALATTAGVAIAHSMGLGLSDALTAMEHLIAHPQESLQAVINGVDAMGPMGVVYFGLIYLVAEIFAVPATPLTLSAGYLFGVTKGASVVLLSATIAASVAFLIGKTFLRSWVETILEDKPQYAKLDRAIGKEGFKLLLLVRLSPIFPFALSNYLYGASSIDFASYFWGTLLGFTPGTIAYVYTGMVGKALTLGGDGDQPWYIYAGGFALLAAFLKTVTDVASEIVEAIDDEEETTSAM